MNRSLPERQANSDALGLSEAEAQRRLDQYGPNEIPERHSHPNNRQQSRGPFESCADVAPRTHNSEHGPAAVLCLGALSPRNQPAFLFEFVFLDLTAGVALIEDVERCARVQRLVRRPRRPLPWASDPAD